MKTDFERLDFRKASQLTFEEPDLETFPCLKLAYECLKAGGTYCAVLNAANEIVVNEFLEDRIGFYEEPDLETFPCLKLAYECLKAGGTYCAVLNAANEIVVNEFLEDRIGFYDIPKYIKMALDAHESIENATLEQILKIDLDTQENM